VDSSSCLPPELLRQWNITVVPHELIIGNRSYRDGVDIHPEEFYRLLKGNQPSCTTAAPRPQQFLEAFLAAGERAPEVLCITLATQLSATYRSACAAVELANGRLAGIKVQVVDSRAAAGASGLIALAAARWAAAGDTLDQVIGKVNRLIPRVNLIAFLDTLAYLGRGGRVRKLEAWAGSLLSIKPLTELRLGEARMLEKPRSRAKATERLLDIMRQRVGSRAVLVNVMEAAAAKDAQALSTRIQADFNCRELFISQFTPVMGLHTGPGLLGTAFYVEEDADPPPSARP
jgi:DegV family protein with EDD domain